MHASVNPAYQGYARPGRSAVAVRGLVALGGGGAVLLALALGIALALYRYPPSVLLIVAAALGMVGTLALALFRFDAAVAAGFALLAVVKFPLDLSDCVFCVVLAVALATGQLNLRRAPTAVVGLIGAFLALNLLSSIEVVDTAQAAKFFPITVYVALLSLWLAGYVRSTRRARVVIRAYLLAAVASAVLGSLALFVHSFPARDLLVFHGDRARGLFDDPNDYGPFLVPAALILVDEMLSPRLLGLRRSTKAVLFLIVTLGVLFSFSRGAWLNYVVGVAVMLSVLALRRGGGRQAVGLLVTVLTVMMLLGTVTAITGSSGFLEERAHLQTYDAERFGAQRTGIEFAATYPLGIGPGQFEVVSPVASHSIYIRVLAEEGVLGLAVLFALLLLTLTLATRNAIGGHSTYGVGSAALLGAWCGVLANSAFVDSLHFRILWVIAALIWAGSMQPVESGRTLVSGAAARG